MNDYLFHPGLYVALGVVAGAAGGWVFQRIWRRLLPRSRSLEFWRMLPVNLRGMMSSPEPDDMLRHYRALLKATAGFAGRNLLGISLGIAPVAIFLLAFDAINLPGRLATEVEACPAARASQLVGLSGKWQVENERLLIDRSALPDVPLRIAGHSVNRTALARKHAFCESTFSCLLFDIMLFETHRIDAGSVEGQGESLVVRPRLLDRNPLWPYLDDFEFWFFVAVMAGSAAAAWRSRQVRASTS